MNSSLITTDLDTVSGRVVTHSPTSTDTHTHIYTHSHRRAYKVVVTNSEWQHTRKKKVFILCYIQDIVDKVRLFYPETLGQIEVHIYCIRVQYIYSNLITIRKSNPWFCILTLEQFKKKRLWKAGKNINVFEWYVIWASRKQDVFPLASCLPGVFIAVFSKLSFQTLD